MPKSDLPTFQYDSRVILMFADSCFQSNQEKLLYLNQVKMQHTLDYRCNNISSGFMNVYKGKDLEMIDNAIENIKLREEYGKQNIEYEDVTKECTIISNPIKPKISADKKPEIADDVIFIHNCDKLYWLGCKGQLRLLLVLLQKYGAIDYTLKDDPDCLMYMASFVDKKGVKYTEKPPQMIMWQFKISDLAYLIMKLETSKLISGSTSKKRARSIFLDERGMNIKEDSFRNSNKKSRIPRHKTEIDEIIQKVKDFKATT